MALTRRLAMIGMAAGLLPGCAWLGFGEDEAEAPETEPPAEGLAARGREPVESVEAIEIGRTAQGVAVAAFGTAPGLGYARPRLLPRRGGELSPDGFIEFDMLAIPPDPDRDLPRGEASARRLRADALIDAEDLAGARGVRVFALQGGRQLSF